ncbi:MAG: prohibitin family protein, partial [Oscillospiraceae bacterium]|nr:prohibitin family protein [Oscillospiraceae bacterium]
METNRRGTHTTRRIVVAALAVIIVLILALSSTVTVRSGTVGVVSVLGAVRDSTLGAGFHVKAPFFTAVTKLNVQTQKTEVNATAASKDLQTVAVTAAINYHIDPNGAALLYKDVGVSY